MGCNSKKIHVIKDESLGGVEREYIKNYEDIIANLVRRVSELEQQTTELEKDNERQAFKIDDLEQYCGGLKDDIETWAQDVEKVRVDVDDLAGEVRQVDDKIEMCIDDIVTLDERTEGDIVLCRSNIEVKERRCYGCRTC